MNVALANTDEVTLRKFLVYSAFLHGALALAIGLSAWYQYRGNQWTNVGGNLGADVKVNLVPSGGIPMLKPDVTSDSHAIDPTKGLYKEEPKPPDIPEVPQDALAIPKFKDQTPPKPVPVVHPDKEFKDEPRKKPVVHPSKVFEDLRPAPPNAVNYGKGGSPNLPTGYGNTPGQTTSGVQIQGQGGGDFATRYGWYVEAVRRKIGSNWNLFEIDPAVRSARRAKSVLTFTINRDGSVKNIRMETSSGNQSMDISAQRALANASPMPPLPNDYSGSYVNVNFDFDLSMTK
jgi:periplasmic protein TonB